jgi:starch phosphorylase
MLFEQVGYKSIKSNDFFEKIFENKDEFVLIDTIVKKENYKQNGVNWVAQNLPELVNKNIVYLCMEMFIPELYYMNENVEYNGAADANFSGGLGILAGCTMEGFADIGLNSCAIVPMYRKRRVQKINTALGQTIFEEEIDYSKNKYLKEFIDEETGEQLEIQVFVDHKKYNVKIWEISRGGTKIYLLQETEIFDILYTGNREQRLKQEVLFGKVVPILLKTLNIKPDILHLNEAHPIIAAVQMKDWKNISNGDNFFEDTRILFTIHTPRTAGMEIYFVNFNKLEIPYYFKPIFDKNNSGKLDFTNAAIELSDRVNTVSNNQIRIVKERIFTDEKYHRKIIGIINGSSKSFWTSELNKEFYDKNDTDILCSDIWQIHKKNKQKAIEYIKNVFSRENIKSTLDLKSDFYLNLSIKKPSAWAIRRIVDYKNQWPLLKDIIRIICAEKGTFIDSIYGRQEGLGFQVVVGGMAHPSDHNSQQWINEFVHWMKGYWRDDISKEFVQAPELIGNFFFLPSFNEGLGRTLKISAIGCDVCLEIPMWDEEACGTSGMRALGNGNICIDSSDGALEWLEDGKNSFLLKPYEPNKILEFMQRISCMYNDLLEKEIKGENLEDDEFLNMKKQAIITWERIINIDIMAQRYANEMFYPVIKVNDLIRK